MNFNKKKLNVENALEDLSKKLNVGNTLKDLSNFFQSEVVASLPVGFIFFENNANKEKRSVEF